MGQPANPSSPCIGKYLIRLGLALRRITLHSGIMNSAAHAHVPETQCADKLARRERVQKAHKNAPKALLNDPIFLRNSNNINELRGNTQHPPPLFR
jgi:hypothetical protein